MRLLPYILFILPLLLTVSCRRDDDAIAVMARAEAVMDSLPDSALALMRTVSRDALRSREGRALYALTMSRALDRNDILVASDSIIAPAVGYYRPDRDPLRHAMTQYYLGRTHFHAGDLPRCIVAMYDGLNTASDNNLYFWEGMTAREIARSFNRMSYCGEELKYARLSYEAFRKSGRRLHTRYALMDFGMAYHNTRNYDSAIVYLRQAVDSAVSNHDTAMEYEAKIIIGKSCYGSGRYKDAISVYDSMDGSGVMTPTDSAVLGLCLLNNGDTAKARAILKDIHDRERLLSDYILLDLEVARNDYVAAFKTLTGINDSTEAISSEIMCRDMIGLVADYYDIQRKAANETIRSNRIIIALIGICLLATCVMAFLVIQFIRIKSRHKLNEKIALAEELKSAYESTAENLEASKLSVQQLMRTRLDLFNQILTLMNDNKNKELSKEKFLEGINRLIDKITPGSRGYNELEQLINSNNNNIVADLRRDLPELKVSDYALFTYSLLGLSLTSISILIGESNINNLYNRKRRLKNKISSLQTARKNDYLGELR